MPEQDNVKPEVREVEMQLQMALFPQDLSPESPFVVFADEPIRPSEEVLEREDEIRRDARIFIEMLNHVATAPPDHIRTPLMQVKTTEQGSTYSSATIEVKGSSKPNAPNKFPGRQIYITETAPIITGDPEVDAENWEGLVRGQVDKLLADYETLARFNTPGASEKKAETLKEVERLRRVPLETVIIQYQTFDPQSKNLQPEVGYKIVRDMTGVQAYPVIYRGRNPIVLRDHPLFAPKDQKIIPELGVAIASNTISEDDYAQTSLAKLSKNIARKAFK